MDKDNKLKDLYFVAVKLLMRDGDKLLITHDIFGEWDLPGGRIRISEFDSPLEEVIERKMNEEIGQDIKYEIGKPSVFFRVERIEQQTPNWDGKKVHIFAIGYEGTYKSGDIKLGDHHDKYEWVNVKTFKPDAYFTGGWLKGVKEYQSTIS